MTDFPCPFSFQTPELGDLWRHWRGLLAPGRLPRRDEIDPGALRRILGIVWIYRLDASGQAWEKIIAGTLDNGLIVSPSGCQFAYSTGGPMQIMTVCDL